jgi:hypothetical protein
MEVENIHIQGAVNTTSRLTYAHDFMRQAHASYKRKHGTPYAEHPEAVLNILTNEFKGTISENTQIIALLHDTLEMGEVDEAEIAREFGPEVLNGVKLLTKQKGEPFSNYAARLRNAPKEIRLVKAADRLHNLREAPLASDPAWALEYVRETREHILPFVGDPWFLSTLNEAIFRVEQSVFTVPKVGDMIYVPSDLYLSHGVDDFQGGKAEVVEVREEISAGLKQPFVRVRENPDTLYNWIHLFKQQEDLKKKFGDQKAHPDPDYRPEFNE